MEETPKPWFYKQNGGTRRFLAAGLARPVDKTLETATAPEQVTARSTLCTLLLGEYKPLSNFKATGILFQ